MRIRPATEGDAAGIARVHVDTWRTTYPGILPDRLLAELSYERREQAWRRILTDSDARQVHLVAEDESGKIVGFADGGPERTGSHGYDCEIYSIYVLAEHQGKGLGRRLMQAVAERLARHGIRSVLLWVARDNPARHFYQALGGQEVGTQQVEIGGVPVDEVAYGWADLGVLTKSPFGAL